MSDNNNRPKRKILESALQEGVHRKEVAGGRSGSARGGRSRSTLKTC